MNQLPFFSKSQRRALLLLEWFLILLVLGIAIYQWKAAPSGRGKSLVSADSTLYNNRARTKEASPYYAVPEEKVETFPFDPNTADSTELLRLGLSPWQVRAIYRYRAKHGRYHTPEDFQRLPGMTVELWERLGPYVRIAERFRYLEPAAQKPLPKSEPLPPADTTKTVVQPATVPDTIVRQEKYEPGTLVDINAADTSELKKIPGIASYRARKIVAYREQLGGYVTTEQVMEACQMPDEILEWVKVSAPSPRLIDVNHLSVQRLMQHPYISFYQARDLVEYRRKHGSLASLDDLSLLPTFSPTEIERLRPYVEFK